MKNNKVIPYVGFGAYIIALGLLIAGFILSILTFKVFGYDVDRFVIVLPILAAWILIVQLTMSFVDKDKPVWTNIIDIAYCVLVLFALAKTLIPFLTNIATYYTVAMGDMGTFAIGVPRCITACVLFAVSCIFFIVGSFFKVVIRTGDKQANKEEK